MEFLFHSVLFGFFNGGADCRGNKDRRRELEQEVDPDKPEDHEAESVTPARRFIKIFAEECRIPEHEQQCVEKRR